MTARQIKNLEGIIGWHQQAAKDYRAEAAECRQDSRIGSDEPQAYAERMAKFHERLSDELWEIHPANPMAEQVVASIATGREHK